MNVQVWEDQDRNWRNPSSLVLFWFVMLRYLWLEFWLWEELQSLVGWDLIPCICLFFYFNLQSHLQWTLVKNTLPARYIILIVNSVSSDWEPMLLNSGTITQLFGAGEAECSVILLWTYVLASVSLTLWSTLFMWLVGWLILYSIITTKPDKSFCFRNYYSTSHQKRESYL